MSNNKYSDYLEKTQFYIDRICELEEKTILVKNEIDKIEDSLHSSVKDNNFFSSAVNLSRAKEKLEDAKNNMNKLYLQIEEYSSEKNKLKQELLATEKEKDLVYTKDKFLDKINSYSKVDEANDSFFAELVCKAIGNRSMRQFADEIGYNVSSISRIINQKNKGQCSDEMVAAIAANAAEGSGVTVDLLMEALGREVVKSTSYFESYGKQIIVSELLARGYSIKQANPSVIAIGDSAHSLDYCISTDAVNKEKWEFEFKTINSSQKFQFLIDDIREIMSFFYCGAFSNSKISFVIDNESVYNSIKEHFMRTRIPDEISIILINNNKIVDEYVIGKSNDNKSIFSNTDEEGVYYNE